MYTSPTGREEERGTLRTAFAISSRAPMPICSAATTISVMNRRARQELDSRIQMLHS
jgi:hypothetical protein